VNPKLLPILPAAIIPAAIIMLDRAGTSDLLSGTVVGALIGLSILGLANVRSRPAA
jgi:hypothetical protein